MDSSSDAVPDVGSDVAYDLLARVREHKPLIQCITNFVSMDIMANTLLAVGASPAMVHAETEVEDFCRIAAALVVNVGTLTPSWAASMKLAAATAARHGKPWVLDPVGAGATPFRTQVIMELVALKPQVIRGNASEIMAVAGAAGMVKGVDSTRSPEEALESGRHLARQLGTIIAISGKEDLITDGERVVRVANGHVMMTAITATGCSLTAMIAALLTQASPSQYLAATAHACAIFGLAGEEASGGTVRGPASLRTAMLDKLWSMSREDVMNGLRVRLDDA